MKNFLIEGLKKVLIHLNTKEQIDRFRKTQYLNLKVQGLLKKEYKAFSTLSKEDIALLKQRRKDIIQEKLELDQLIESTKIIEQRKAKLATLLHLDEEKEQVFKNSPESTVQEYLYRIEKLQDLQNHNIVDREII